MNIISFEEICPYCLKARLHAKRHGNSEAFVVCSAHRMLNWWTNNAYHPGNVSWRNPISAESYAIPVFREEGIGCFSNLKKEEVKMFYQVPPQFSFAVIAQIPPLLLKHGEKVGIFYPSVIADVEDGEYENRRFSIIFGIWNEDEEHYEWGLLEAQINYIFSYLGYSELRPLIETCVYGSASKNVPDTVYYYEQRKICSECE